MTMWVYDVRQDELTFTDNGDSGRLKPHYPPEEELQRIGDSGLAPDLKRRLFSAVNSAQHKLENQGGDAEHQPLELWIMSVMPDSDTPLYIVGCTDKTPHQPGDMHLEALLAAVDDSADAIYLNDAETLQYFYVNKAAERHTGYSKSELLEMNTYDLNPEMDWGYIQLLEEESLKRRPRKYVRRGRHQRKDGSFLPVEVYSEYVATPSGRAYFFTQARDISEQIVREHQAEALRKATDESHELIFSWDAKTKRIVYANNIASRILNRDKETLTGQVFTELLKTDSAGKLEGFVASLAAGQVDSLKCLFSFTGDTRSDAEYEFMLQAVLVSDGALIVATGRDQAVERRYQSRLSAMREILDQTSDSVFVYGARSMRFEYVNDAACSVLGYSRAELLKMGPHDVNASMKPSEISEFIEQTVAGTDQSSADQTNRILQVKQRKKSGESIDLELNVSALSVAQGQQAMIVVAGRDIREREARRLKERQLHDQLLASRKLESVGRLAGGVAHDFNNMLTVMQNAVEILSLESPQGSEEVGHIMAAIGRSRDLTTQLLAVGRRQVLSIETLEINSVIRGFHELLKRLVHGHVRIKLQLHTEPCFAKFDSSQLEQVLLNLVGNAADASPRGETVYIKTEHVSIAEMGAAVKISVADNGSGIPDDYLDRIFEPFFTTKAQGHGAGLGLATADGIVAQCDGKIEVESELGIGTCISIYLPLQAASTQRTSAIECADDATGTMERIGVLVVDDEPSVLKLTEKLLRANGYATYAASNTFSAVRLVQQDEGHNAIQVALIDLSLDGESGEETLLAIRGHAPDLPAIFMSGYAENVLTESIDNATFLAKPFLWKDLENALTSALPTT